MAAIQILYIHSMMFHGRAWQHAADLLAEHDISLSFVDQGDGVANLTELQPDILVAELSIGGQGFEEIVQYGNRVNHRLGLAADTPANFTTFDDGAVAAFASYTARLSPVNYAGAMVLLAHAAGFTDLQFAFEEVHTCGIYHPEAGSSFFRVDAYLHWQQQRGIPFHRIIAIIFYYGQLVEGRLAEIDALILECEEKGLCPVAIFSAGIEDEPDLPDWYTLLTEIPSPGAVINCLAGRLLKRQEDTLLLEKLGVPVIQALRSYSQTPGEWLEDPQGLPSMSAVFTQTYPEMFGAVRPTMIAGLDKHPEDGQSSWMRNYQPITERIETLVNRLVCHFRLRETPNSKKKLTVVLHNNPCKGVEATVGMAVGLDTMKSLGLLIQQLASAGYDTGDCPTDGQALLATIMEKKAIAEFRWTTIDEIVAKGGDLHMMDAKEYHHWFDRQDERVKSKIINDWGPFPGEGMVWQRNGRDLLVITGLHYGNIQIINQPKRGCYGAKCTGEVCRILHDPTLSPPHHWFATYKYIQDNSDAVIHFGTEGALEYLPGKQNGLSGGCFPEVSLGGLPNFYVYVMDAIGEGMVAKRRGHATLVDHLGPILSPAELDEKMVNLERLLNQYSAAESSGDSSRVAELKEKIRPLMKELQLTGEDSFEKQVDLARRRLAAIQRTLSPEGLHTLGQAPSSASRGRLLATMLRKPPEGLESTEELAVRLNCVNNGYSRIAGMLATLSSISPEDEAVSTDLRTYCLEVEERLSQCHQEIDRLIDGLAGSYIPPGPAGSLTGGRIDLLPTGRNFYGKDVFLLPTRAAYQVGRQMAHDLLGRYLEEEGRFPERVGVSIWSSDAFKSDGELFCQILTLMGVRPCWDKQETVIHLEAIPLQELQLEYNGELRPRPRVDVTIETSGIMRDMVPHFCDLLDQAVLLVSELEEPHEWNAVKKHTDQMMEELLETSDNHMSTKKMRRMATFRVFSSAPGTYGLGVGLALDASAWTTDKELAEIYINWGGHAYGSGNRSTVARDMLARQLAQLDIAYMKQASEEYDILDCGCYSVSQGSMATATRALSCKQVKLYWTEAGGDRELCDVKEQLQRSAATRLLNAHWIESMKEHGYQGAMAVSGRVNNLFKWSVTSHEVSKELFDRVVSTYILDEENRRWLMEQNPYSMEEITRRLLEAASRELWEPDDSMLRAVQHMALEVEGEMEEIMGEVSEEFQGGKVEVLGADMVDKWQHEWRIGND